MHRFRFFGSQLFSLVLILPIVQSESWMFPVRKNEFRAIPVTMPGRAIGRMSTSEKSWLPKNRNRCTANAAAVPRTSAIPVAIRPTRIESHIASRISVLSQAVRNHFVENDVIGHP